MSNSNPIGIIDSGIGGLTVLDEIRYLLPMENYIYISDSSFMPYGNKQDNEIINRLYFLANKLLDLKVKAIVLACNTATNVAIDYLRNKYAVSILGVEPAIKPAIEKTRGYALVLTTVLTSRQKKFLDLCEKYGDNRLIIAPQENLAYKIEKNKKNLNIFREDISELLCKHCNISSVVLGCTHFVYLKPIFNQVAPHLPIFDGNKGTAANLRVCLIRDNKINENNKNRGKVYYLRT